MRNRTTKSTTFITKIIIIPALLLVIFILTAVTRETYKKNQIQKEIDSLQAKAQQIEKENLAIQEKIAYFDSSNYKEKEAKDKLNLQDPGENVVVIKPSVAKEAQIEQKTSSDLPAGEPKIPNPAKWWDYFFKY